MGVAGSYLLRRLSLEHDVVGFDNQRRESFKYNRRKKGGEAMNTGDSTTITATLMEVLGR